MTQMRRKDDDIIELYKATGSGCRVDTLKNEEEDDIVELYNASLSGCTTTLKNLIDIDPCILNKISLTSFSETPLHISALLGHLDFTKTLLAQNPQLVVELDFHKRCPLHLASAEGHIEIVQALLHGNDNTCLIHDQYGRIPLHYAAMRGRVKVVKELIAVWPDSTQVMLDGGETILRLCIKYNQLEALKLLVDPVRDARECLNSKDHGGNTILHLAVMLKQIETVKYLLSMSNVREALDVRNGMSVTALEVLDHCQKDFRNFTIRNILIDAGAERPNDQNNLPPSSTMVVGHQESAKPVQLIKKWWKKLLKHLRDKGDWINESRGTLMVVATVITTITFQPAINPPGGVWQTDVRDSHQASGCSQDNICEAGTSVIAYKRENEYFTFMICITVSFSASLCIIFLLISGFPLRNKVCMGFLTLSMCTTLTFLAAAYLFAFIMLVPYQADYYYDNFPYKAMVLPMILSLLVISKTLKQENTIEDEPVVDLLTYLNNMLDVAVAKARLPSGRTHYSSLS
ncbi:uncharacterized protein LOC142634675 [Castanea sativa]|uniref:uncharacterized protein LOC142634675 n=1 Tax=Castanea sativa TaxID=21020 RepID=UPI003F64D47F